MIKQLLNKDNIVLNLEANNKEAAIKKLIESVNIKLHSKEQFYQDVLQRESEISTGLTNGIAIPHSQSDSVEESFIAIAKINNIIEWETLDNSNVNFIILIGVPKKDKNNTHLSILAQVANKLMDEDIVEAIVFTENKDEIISLLEE